MIILSNPEHLHSPKTVDFEHWITLTLEHQNTSGDVGVLIVDAAKMHTLNKTYRHKDKPTNVLAFPFEAPPGTQTEELGDIILCVPVIEQEASDQHKTLQQHFAHLTIHATLHLLGFDHQTPEQAAKMESIEITLLHQLQYPNPYEV